ncbi:MAG: hypothetical protein RJA70_2087 [Pseudomonadota bacterium]|jgi:hypothetical protein
MRTAVTAIRGHLAGDRPGVCLGSRSSLIRVSGSVIWQDSRDCYRFGKPLNSLQSQWGLITAGALGRFSAVAPLLIAAPSELDLGEPLSQQNRGAS